MEIKELKPNHICRNMACTNGEDGGRKHYYACDYCDARHKWRSFACSISCYEAYMNDEKNKGVALPERTDKTEAEINELMEKPIEEVKAATLEELSDYADVIEEKGISGAVDAVNEDIVKGKTKTKKKKDTSDETTGI